MLIPIGLHTGAPHYVVLVDTSNRWQTLADVQLNNYKTTQFKLNFPCVIIASNAKSKQRNVVKPRRCMETRLQTISKFAREGAGNLLYERWSA